MTYDRKIKKYRKRFFTKRFHEVLSNRGERTRLLEELFEKEARKNKDNKPTTIKIGMMPFPISKKPLHKVFKRSEKVGRYMPSQPVSIYNGRFYVNYQTNSSSCGRKFGEFAYTKQWKGTYIHRKKKKKKKKKAEEANLKQQQGNKAKQPAKGGKVVTKSAIKAKVKEKAKVKPKPQAGVGKGKGK